MKTVQIKKAFWQILESIDASTLVNAYFGGSNITADYLNDFSSNAIDGFLGDWIEDHVNRHDTGELSVSDILIDPDYLIQYSACEFFGAFCGLFSNSVDAADIEKLFRDCPKKFDAWGKYYLFARPFSNACTQYWLIRADSETSAYEILTEEYEKDFQVDEDEVDEDTAEYNENGTPVNTDNLMLIGTIEGADK